MDSILPVIQFTVSKLPQGIYHIEQWSGQTWQYRDQEEFLMSALGAIIQLSATYQTDCRVTLFDGNRNYDVAYAVDGQLMTIDQYV